MTDREDRPPRIEDVAAEAGVSVSSVSRVLSAHPDVSSKMRQRVLQAAEQLNYEPDYLAKSLRSGSTQTFAFLVRDISNPLFADMARGIDRIARASGYLTLVLNSDGDPGIEAQHILTMHRRRVDAYLVSLVDEGNDESVSALKSSGGKVVLLDREVAGVSASSVLIDHYSGTRAAALDMAQRGLGSRVAVVGGGARSRPTRERLRGFSDGLEEAGLHLSESMTHVEGWSKSYAASVTRAMLDQEQPPTAILAGGTQSTVGVVEVLEGIPSEQRPALVACDELPLLSYLPFVLGVVRRDAVVMGVAAAQLALEMCAGTSGEPRTIHQATAYAANDRFGKP